MKVHDEVKEMENEVRKCARATNEEYTRDKCIEGTKDRSNRDRLKVR